MANIVFTIGHSTHPMQDFVSLLNRYNITAVADVRSHPYSRYNPQYNQKKIKDYLREYGIKYVFLGEELGARSQDPNCYEDGKVQFDRLSQTELFQKGIERIVTGVKKYKIALMCAEKDPIDCHRTILVSRRLSEEGLKVNHILADGSVESQGDIEQRLISIFKMDGGDLFLSDEEIREQAYRKQGDVIAYTEKNEDNDADVPIRSRR